MNHPGIYFSVIWGGLLILSTILLNPISSQHTLRTKGSYACPPCGCGVEKFPGIGMARKGTGFMNFHDQAGIHHRDAIAGGPGQFKIMGDQQDPDTCVATQLLK